jgi:cysteine desulfuration protein SufE
MYTSCLSKQQSIKDLFSQLPNEEAKYSKIIELGRALPRLSPEYKIPELEVKGCQSIMYMRSWEEEGKIFFQVDSDALISAGLAALLIHVYSGETPETILKCPPHYLEEMGIAAALTPNRANGLYSIHLKMKQDALSHLLKKS